MDIDVSKLPTTSTVKTDRLYIKVFLTNNLQEPGFQGFVKSLTTQDKAGPFDILPDHENFVTSFSKGLRIVPEQGEPIDYKDKTGVIEVANNVVRVFLKN